MVADEITIDQLMKAMHDAGLTGDLSDEGKTTNELAEAWNCSRRRATVLLHGAAALGILRRGTRSVTNLAGNPSRVPVYSFIVDKPAKSRRRGK
jgi:hypothetical protein